MSKKIEDIILKKPIILYCIYKNFFENKPCKKYSKTEVICNKKVYVPSFIEIKNNFLIDGFTDKLLELYSNRNDLYNSLYMFLVNNKRMPTELDPIWKKFGKDIKNIQLAYETNALSDILKTKYKKIPGWVWGYNRLTRSYIKMKTLLKKLINEGINISDVKDKKVISLFKKIKTLYDTDKLDKDIKNLYLIYQTNLIIDVYKSD